MKTIKVFVLCLLIGFSFSSCSKSDAPLPEEETLDTAKMAGTNFVPARAIKVREVSYQYSAVVPYKDASGKTIWDKANSEIRQGKGYVYYDEKFQVVYVVNWPGEQGDAASGAFGFKPFYFNFDTRNQVDRDAAEAGTAAWHIKHYDIYTAYIASDATTANNEPGLGKSRIVRTAFDELDEAPATAMVRNGIEIEMDGNATVDGWGTYRLSDHIVRPYKDRTMIFQLKDGRYVKYQLMNLYRTNPQVVVDKYEFEAPFYSFKYYIQPSANDRTLKTR